MTGAPPAVVGKGGLNIGIFFIDLVIPTPVMKVPSYAVIWSVYGALNTSYLTFFILKAE